MTHESSWEQLADQLDSIKTTQSLWAQWHAYVGSEDYGIWILRPEGPGADQARAKFSLIAAQAIQKLSIPPVPVPKRLQHCPHWTEYCRAEEEIARRAGQVRDLSDAVPHGLDKIDWDAVDPCSRAWLELLRRESRAFRVSTTGNETIKGAEYFGLSGRIDDLCGASAAYCKQRARDEIGARLASRLENQEAAPSSVDHGLVQAAASLLDRFQGNDGAEKENRPPGVAEFEEQRQAEREKIRLALRATDRDEKTHQALVTAEFWERRQAEFEKYAVDYADLAANWEPSQGWYFWWGEKPEVIEVPKEPQRAFNALARKALAGVPQLAALDMEPWQVWLEFMHYCHWPFEVPTIIPGSLQREWDSAVKDGITVWNYRDEVKYARDDPNRWHYGLLLKRVFQASAFFCLELSACAGEDAGVFASERGNPEEGNLVPRVVPSAKPEAPAPEKDAHVDLLLKIVNKRAIRIETWAKDHNLGRTTVFDWKAARAAGKTTKGKVSDEKIDGKGDQGRRRRARTHNSDRLGLARTRPS